MSKQVYFEGIYGRLTAVSEPDMVSKGTARATVSKHDGIYEMGEVIVSDPYHFVTKVRVSASGTQWVRQWTAPRPVGRKMQT